jgi:hypothetical protein
MAELWTCPSCRRDFTRDGQSHECAPALTLEEYFSTGPEFERPIVERILAHLRSLGDVRVEAVQVGVFVKRAGTFVELRPQRHRVALSMLLPRPIEHPRIVRRVPVSGGRTACFVHLSSPSDVDDDMLAWLTESFLAAPD